MIIPQWPVPTWIRGFTTTRQEGNFDRRYGTHEREVINRRNHLMHQLGLDEHPLWLDQVHGNAVLEVTPDTLREKEPVSSLIQADGVWTTTPGIPCAILTADCLPLLLCDEAGTVVSALHCGWRSLQSGIIHKAIEAMRPKIQERLLAWMGPAIGPAVFEVGAEVRDQFMQLDVRFAQAFKPQPTPGKFLADIYQIAKFQLALEGVTGVYGGEYCTYTQADQFYSYRREGNAGRLATCIWMEPHNMATFIWIESQVA